MYPRDFFARLFDLRASSSQSRDLVAAHERSDGDSAMLSRGRRGQKRLRGTRRGSKRVRHLLRRSRKASCASPRHARSPFGQRKASLKAPHQASAMPSVGGRQSPGHGSPSRRGDGTQCSEWARLLFMRSLLGQRCLEQGTARQTRPFEASPASLLPVSANGRRRNHVCPLLPPQ